MPLRTSFILFFLATRPPSERAKKAREVKGERKRRTRNEREEEREAKEEEAKKAADDAKVKAAEDAKVKAADKSKRRKPGAEQVQHKSTKENDRVAQAVEGSLITTVVTLVGVRNDWDERDSPTGNRTGSPG